MSPTVMILSVVQQWVKVNLSQNCRESTENWDTFTILQVTSGIQTRIVKSSAMQSDALEPSFDGIVSKIMWSVE
jgi:hypothetical protein